MQRVFSTGLRRAYSSSVRVNAESAAATPAASLLINFCTPHAPVYKKKAVQSVVIPGASGEYGVTVGHSALISQLQPGVVTVNHLNVNLAKFGRINIIKYDRFDRAMLRNSLFLVDLL